MKNRAFAYSLALAFLLVPALTVASGLWDLGKVVIDKGDFQLYRIHEDRESIKSAMGVEKTTRSRTPKTLVKAFQAWTDDGSGEAFSWFTVGDMTFFRCGFDVADDGDVTITLQIRGPNQFKETYTFSFSLSAGAYILSTSTPVLPFPGYYTFTFKVKARELFTVAKGMVSVLSVM